jgi:ABC-2 type transport system ATP-binding protein
MDEADRCSKVGLMYQGNLVICDTPINIRNRIEGEIIELHSNQWKAAHSIIETFPWVLEIQTYGEALHIFVDSAQKRMPKLEEKFKKQNIQYKSIRQVTPRMEEAFISLIRKLEN